MSEHSVVVYTVGPKWQRELPLQSQDRALGHIRFVRRILGEGIARVAGPFCRLDECVEGDTVGLIVFNAPVEMALSLVAQDPAVEFGLMVPSVHAFFPVDN